MTKDLLKELTGKYPQYVPIMEHVEWNGSYVKEHYTYKDLKLYWWTSLVDMHAIESMIYAEGLILLYHGKLTYEYLETACLKIILKKTKGTLLDSLDIVSIRETIHNTYDYIIENKEEMLRADKDWRPKMKFDLQPHTHKKKLTKEEFIAILDECKEKTGHRTKKSCMQYFIEKTGLSGWTFEMIKKKYKILFDEKEPTGGFYPRTKKANKTYWVNEIHGEEWKLSIEEISKLLVKRDKTLRKDIDNPYSECVLTKTTIKNWKYKKMKELGLKAKTEEKTKKKTIPSLRMDFSCHQIQ